MEKWKSLKWLSMQSRVVVAELVLISNKKYIIHDNLPDD